MAVQVRVTLYSPAHAPAVVTLEDVRVNAEPQASDAVAVANEGVEVQLMVLIAGSDTMTGAVISWTFIVCDAVDEFPQASVAVNVRVTEYEHAQAPAVVTLEEVSVNADPQASEAVAVANEGVEVQLMVEAEGSDTMTGAVISWTFMV